MTTSRADWTLLLPLRIDPLREAFVDGSPETGTTLIEVGLACSWKPVAEAVGSAPLVVSRVDGTADLKDLADLVADDGVLYRECRRTELARAIELLERAGLVVQTVHGIAPSAASPRRYVPLDSPAALRWYVAHLFQASTLRQRSAQIAAVTALRVSSARALTKVAERFPEVAVVATRRRHLETRVEAVVTSGQDSGSRSVVIAFDSGRRDPVSVAKVALRPAAVGATRGEDVRVQHLRRTLPYSLASAIPRPIGVRSTVVGDIPTETCARGTSLQMISARWSRPGAAKLRDLRAVVDWLVDFGNATAVMGGLDTPPWLSVLPRAAAIADLPQAVRGTLIEVSEHLASSPHCQRSVHVHGDAGPWNVHAGGLVRRRLSVIDWESEDDHPPLGPPLVDVVYLCTYFSFAARRVSDRAGEITTLLDLFDTSRAADRLIRGVRNVLDDAARRVGLTSADLLPLAIALWAGQAIDVRERRARLGSGAESGQAPDAYLVALSELWKEVSA